jgi:hypothetical protein
LDRIDHHLHRRDGGKSERLPQPTTPVSVVTFTISESAVCNPALPHTAASDLPPAVNGMRSGIDSMLAMFMKSPFFGEGLLIPPVSQ